MLNFAWNISIIINLIPTTCAKGLCSCSCSSALAQEGLQESSNEGLKSHMKCWRILTYLTYWRFSLTISCKNQKFLHRVTIYCQKQKLPVKIAYFMLYSLILLWKYWAQNRSSYAVKTLSHPQILIV